MAANQGNATAQYNLGNLYTNGKGIEKNYIKAAEWYKKAANQGYTDAQCYLGNCYWLGRGIFKSPVLAYYWLSISYYNDGNHKAKELLDAFEPEMTFGQIQDAQQRVTKWHEALESNKS